MAFTASHEQALSTGRLIGGLVPSSGVSQPLLHQAFSNQDVCQEYLCAPSDGGVRRFLARIGRLPNSEKANTDEVKESMHDFLRGTYPDVTPPVLYAGLVRSLLRHMSQKDPSRL